MPSSGNCLRGCYAVCALMLLALLSAAAHVAAQTAATPSNGTDTHPNAKTETRDRSTVPISFLPPPLENATYSLGIYEAKSGKLVRTLHRSAAESAFTVGLNGFITQWDRKDDAGKTVPPGKYAARGYAVGAWKVEGVAIHGNDWVSEDEDLRIKQVESIALVLADGGLLVLAKMSGDSLELMRFSGDKESKLLWRRAIPAAQPDNQPWLQLDEDNVAVFPNLPSSHGDFEISSIGLYQVSDGSEIKGRSLGFAEKASPLPPLPPSSVLTGEPALAPSPTVRAPELTVNTGTAADKSELARDSGSTRRKPHPANAINNYTARSNGKNGSTWLAGGYAGLAQQAADHSVLRAMEVTPGEPTPRAVSASTKEDRLYLLEEKDGWQRVRGLSWVDAKDEGGKAVSTWETFFERNIRTPDSALGLEDPATAKASSPVVELSLVKNELSPTGKPARAKLTADFDPKGSYLTTADGLRLRQISERANLRAVKLVKGKAAGSLTFFQTDGAAWDEFSIAGADKLMSFDAGEFELTATGEKPVESKAPEPDL